MLAYVDLTCIHYWLGPTLCVHFHTHGNPVASLFTCPNFSPSLPGCRGGAQPHTLPPSSSHCNPFPVSSFPGRHSGAQPTPHAGWRRRRQRGSRRRRRWRRRRRRRAAPWRRWPTTGWRYVPTGSPATAGPEPGRGAHPRADSEAGVTAGVAGRATSASAAAGGRRGAAGVAG